MSKRLANLNLKDKEKSGTELSCHYNERKALRMEGCLVPGRTEMRLVWPEMREQGRQWDRLGLHGKKRPDDTGISQP